MARFKYVLMALVVLLLLLSAAAGCSGGQDFDSQIEDISSLYRFDLFDWEVGALAGLLGDAFDGGGAASDDTGFVFTYFENIQRMRGLLAAIDGDAAGDITSLRSELDALRDDTTGRAKDIVARLKADIRQVLSEVGINNPFERYLKMTFLFPPIAAVLERPPHLLVVSPRDRIESVRRVELLPEMSREQMEDIEARVDALGLSSLVVPLGGIATYPSFVASDGDLRFTIDSIVHEWLHQYLAFTPLGSRYVLHIAGLRPDDDIATMNETVVNIVSKEIGAIVYERYCPGAAATAPPPEVPPTGFDFNKVMRETRLAVDAYLAAGEVDRAEEYMEQQRQYLAANGYYIRKLNQAYFAFHGAYADSPASVSPIGADIKTLRAGSPSLKDFLDAAADMTSVEDLKEKILNSKL